MSSSPAALRARYLADSIATASPARLLVMLYDRLILDLAQGEEAVRTGDRGAGSDRLLHAQDILSELLATLTLATWSGADGLANLYRFLLSELAQANMKQDARRVATCRELVEPLRDAWREAALAATPAAGTAARGSA